VEKLSNASVTAVLQLVYTDAAVACSANVCCSYKHVDKQHSACTPYRSHTAN